MTTEELAALVAIFKQKSGDLSEELKVLGEQLAFNAAEKLKRRRPR